MINTREAWRILFKMEGEELKNFRKDDAKSVAFSGGTGAFQLIFNRNGVQLVIETNEDA